MKKYSRVSAKIDLDAIIYNINQMKEYLGEKTKIMAVVKADGYGYGAIPIARCLEKEECLWGYAVATMEEAVLLRKHEITKPILVLGCIFPEQYEEMLKYEIRMTVYTEEMAEKLSEYAIRKKKKAFIHIKIDTGLSRLGFNADQEGIECIQRISSMKEIEIEGMYTHFADVDNKDYTDIQRKKFGYVKKELERTGVKIPLCHVANSSAIIDMPETKMDIVRAGTALYGIFSTKTTDRNKMKLKPALSIISHIISVKWIEKGVAVGYGCSFMTKRRTKIVVVPVGYSDGYPRSLSNKGYVLIHGEKAPILGRLCMDMFMVDATEIENVVVGDEIILLGKDRNNEISMEILSELSERSYNDLMGSIGKRVPREYIKGGKIVEQIDCF